MNKRRRFKAKRRRATRRAYRIECCRLGVKDFWTSKTDPDVFAATINVRFPDIAEAV